MTDVTLAVDRVGGVYAARRNSDFTLTRLEGEDVPEVLRPYVGAKFSGPKYHPRRFGVSNTPTWRLLDRWASCHRADQAAAQIAAALLRP
jgi:hypothetical protein